MENQLHITQNIMQKSTTAGNIVFLLLSFPLGLCYFLFTIVGLSLGVSTLVIWIGLPVLFITLLLVRGMAQIERRMASRLLGLPTPSQTPEPHDPGRGFLRHLGRMLRDPSTWTSMIYMILKLPVGIVNFTLALTLPIVSAAVILLPLAYLIQLFINLILLKSGVSIANSGIIIPYFIEVHGSFDLVMFVRSFIGVPIGLALWFASRFLLNGLARLSGELVHALL